MRKGGFNMYLMKDKKESALYQGYKPQFPNYQEAEAQVYVSQVISRDISKQMQVIARSMSTMIVGGLMEEGGKRGRK